jgi:GTP cyclohydrolase I
MPFYGRCHVAYLPSSGAVLGLSKLARITKLFAKRLQTQGQLGQQVLQCMQQQLEPLGVAVLLQAKHLGFGGADVQHFTAAVNGVFATEPSSQLQVSCCCCAAPPSIHLPHRSKFQCIPSSTPDHQLAQAMHLTGPVQQ